METIEDRDKIDKTRHKMDKTRLKTGTVKQKRRIKSYNITLLKIKQTRHSDKPNKT